MGGLEFGARVARRAGQEQAGVEYLEVVLAQFFREPIGGDENVQCGLFQWCVTAFLGGGSGCGKGIGVFSLGYCSGVIPAAAGISGGVE